MLMTKEKLQEKMLEYIETQDGEYDDEWYASQRDFAATILSDFAEYLGVELVVPEYVPKKTRPQVDRDALLKSLLPDICKMFDIKYKELDEKMKEEWEKREEEK